MRIDMELETPPAGVLARPLAADRELADFTKAMAGMM